MPQLTLRLSTLALAILSCTLAAQALPGEDRPITSWDPAWTTSRLNLRQGPGSSYPVLEVLDPGVRVWVESREGDWCRVNPVESLWVHCDYLSEHRPSSSPVSLGSINRHYWEGQVQRNYVGQVSVGQVSGEQALRILSAETRRRVSGQQVLHIGGSSFDDFPDSVGRLVVAHEELPIFVERAFTSDHFLVLGLLQAGSKVALLETFQESPRFPNPFDATPVVSGDWAQVLTPGGDTGWVYLEPLGMASIIDRPPPPRQQYTSTGCAIPSGFFALLVLGLVVWLFSKLLKQSTAGGASPGQPSGASSGAGSSYSSTCSAEQQRSEQSAQPSPTWKHSGRSYNRENWLGERYLAHEDGSRSTHSEDWLGNKYTEDEDGSRSHHRENWLGEKYIAQEDGSRSYHRKGWLGDDYIEHPDGSRSNKKTDWLGNTYWEHDDD